MVIQLLLERSVYYLLFATQIRGNNSNHGYTTIARLVSLLVSLLRKEGILIAIMVIQLLRISFFFIISY